MLRGTGKLSRLLDALEVDSGDLIYLHTSFRRMSYLGLSAEDFLQAFLERLGGDGTLVLPSFAWHLDPSSRPWKGYREYFEKRPVFDVRNTPANIGRLPELFRTLPGVKRSLSYWWSIAAKGKLASELTAGQEKVLHYYGEGSSFELLRTHGVKIVGLGVTLNTTSLALIPDYLLGARHTQRLFTDEPEIGIVVNENGHSIETRSFWLLPEVVRLIKPSAVFALSPRLGAALRRADEGDTIQFSYPFAWYHEESLRLGEEACARGDAMPWLADYPVRRGP